jgi:uncharacterized protein (TIRG00374 family)
MFQPHPQEPTQVPRILGYGLAIACLIWVLHDFHIMKAIRDLAKVDYRWVLAGMGFDVVSYFVQAARWKFLLNPFGKVRLTKSIRAVYAGLFANLVFPLRPGELLRSYLLSNSEDIGIGRVLGSVGVERLIDLVIAVASLAVASLMVDLQQFRKIVYTLAIITLVVLGFVVALILYLEIKLGDRESFEGRKAHLPGKFMSALVGLHAMGTSPSFYPAVLFSLLMPFCQVMGMWAMMRGYGLTSGDGLPLSFFAAVVVLLVINLGVSLPNAPANIGAWQFFCVLGLGWFNIEKSTATGFSIFAFLALNLPFVFLGFAALVRSGLSLKTMRERVSHLPGEVQSSATKMQPQT